MSTETKRKPSRGVYLLPFATAVPIAGAVIYAAVRGWPQIHKLLNILIKLVVRA